MGTLFRAITGILLALLVYGHAPDLGVFQKVREDIASAHPINRLADELEQRWQNLIWEFPAQNDTTNGLIGPEFQARRLHFSP